jgi:peptidoglycan hydrolase CwlO-like protein
MAELLNWNFTQEQARQMDSQIEEMLARMRKANEQMARDQEDIERLKKETAVIIADIQKKVA